MKAVIYWQSLHFVTVSYKPGIDKVSEGIYSHHSLWARKARRILSALKPLITQAAWTCSRGRLPFQAQRIDYGSIAINIFVLHIVQQSAASADKHQQASAGMMVFLVNF